MAGVPCNSASPLLTLVPISSRKPSESTQPWGLLAVHPPPLEQDGWWSWAGLFSWPGTEVSPEVLALTRLNLQQAAMPCGLGSMQAAMWRVRQDMEKGREQRSEEATVPSAADTLSVLSYHPQLSSLSTSLGWDSTLKVYTHSILIRNSSLFSSFLCWLLLLVTWRVPNYAMSG